MITLAEKIKSQRNGTRQENWGKWVGESFALQYTSCKHRSSWENDGSQPIRGGWGWGRHRGLKTLSWMRHQDVMTALGWGRRASFLAVYRTHMISGNRKQRNKRKRWAQKKGLGECRASSWLVVDEQRAPGGPGLAWEMGFGGQVLTGKGQASQSFKFPSSFDSVHLMGKAWKQAKPS